MQKAPTKADAFHRVEQLLASGSLEENVRPLLQAALSGTADSATLLGLAGNLFQKDCALEALALTRMILEETPESSDALYLHCRVLYRLSAYRALIGAVKSWNANGGPPPGERTQRLLERAMINAGQEPEPLADPAWRFYGEPFRRLQQAGPVPIVRSIDESTLEPWQKRMLKAYRDATGKAVSGSAGPDSAQSDQEAQENRAVGKSSHWDRFRNDFEYLIATAPLWPRFRQLGLTHGMDDTLFFRDPKRPFAPAGGKMAPEEARPAPFSVARLYEYTVACLRRTLEVMPQERVAELSENDIGAPVGFRLLPRSGPVNYHDLSCIYYADRIARHAPEQENLRILEIGGGYGAMAAKLKQLFPGARTVLVDLPESGAFQYYYLSCRFPDAVILTVSDLVENPDILKADWDFITLPNTATDLVAELGFDMAINVRSFMEMEVATIRHYTSWFDRSLRAGGVCYLANRVEKQIGDTVIRFEDYGIPGRWTLEGTQSIPLQYYIHEWVYRVGG